MVFIISQKVPDPRVVGIPLGSQPMDPRGDVMRKAQRGKAPGSARLQWAWKHGQSAQVMDTGQTELVRTQVMWEKLVLAIRTTRSRLS